MCPRGGRCAAGCLRAHSCCDDYGGGPVVLCSGGAEMSPAWSWPTFARRSALSRQCTGPARRRCACRVVGAAGSHCLSCRLRRVSPLRAGGGDASPPLSTVPFTRPLCFLEPDVPLRLCSLEPDAYRCLCSIRGQDPQNSTEQRPGRGGHQAGAKKRLGLRPPSVAVLSLASRSDLQRRPGALRPPSILSRRAL